MATDRPVAARHKGRRISRRRPAELGKDETMIGSRSLKCAVLASFAALGGCAGMSEGPVPVSRGLTAETAEPDLSRIRSAIQTDCLNLPALPADPDWAALRIRRNILVTAYMAAADIRYNAYERDLLAFSRQNDLGAALATQLVSAIGAASGSLAVSEAANITSGTIGATQAAFSKSLLNQTVSILQTHMRAERLRQYASNTDHLALPYEQWNSCQALQDALAYEQAGTLNAALAAMAASATDEERDGTDEAADAVERITFTGDAQSLAFRTYLRRGQPQRDTARAALNELVAGGTIARPADGNMGQYLRQFQVGRGTPAERLALMRLIVRKENGSEAGVSLNEALPPP
jgi:hypothetical protein